MKVFTGRSAAVFATLSMAAVAMLGLAGPASAEAPYGGNSLQLSLNTTQPCEGGSLTATVSGGKVGDSISILIHTTPVKQLGTLTLGASKSASGSFTLPAGLTGSLEILAVDTSAGNTTSGITTAAGNVNVVKCSGVDPVTLSQPTSGVDALAFTGVAVAAFGIVALVLLVGGGVLILAGRRASKSTVNAS